MRPPELVTPVLAGVLGDWVTRANAAAAQLYAHPEVRVLAHWQGAPVAAAVLDEIEAKLGFSLGEAVRSLYLQADGFALAWAPKGLETPPPRRGQPDMLWLERLGSQGHVIALRPVAEVFGLRGAPTMDYAEFLDDGGLRVGFDFPGNYYTPAYVRVGDELRVAVGDDHGAAWDGPQVTLERYLEDVLASWGSVQARAKQFVSGRGAALAPVPLASLLPTRAALDEKKLYRALEQLRWAEELPETWSDLTRQGLRARDEEVVRVALDLIERVGAPAEALRDELSALIGRGVRVWQVGAVLARLPAAPLGADFEPLLACAAGSISEMTELAQTLARSLELDPNPRHLAAWRDTLRADRPTPYLVALHLRAPALRELAGEALAERVSDLPDAPIRQTSGDAYAAFAWVDLHPDERRPAIVEHLRDVLLHGFHAEEWLRRALGWPALDACLDAALLAAAQLGELDARREVARSLAQRGPAVVSALNHLLDDPEPESGYHRQLLLREIAPELPLDEQTRGRVAAMV